MSRKIITASARSLPLAAAALLIHIGAAAAATPPSDFQRQVSAVLAGNIATHATQADSTRDGTSGTKADAQEFARQLLSGWSVSHPGRARSATESRRQTTAAVTRQASPARDDFQIMVQRFLQGEKAAARSAS